MTTTISKHDLQLQQQQQQQLQLQQQQQKQQQLQQQQQAPPTRPTISFKSAYSSSVGIVTLVPTTTTTTTDEETIQMIPTTAARLDSATTIIQVDSLNNNSYSLDPAIITLTTTPTTTTSSRGGLNNNGCSSGVAVGLARGSPDGELAPVAKGQKRRSLLNFRSLDFHIKSLYSGLRNGNSKNSQSQCSSLGGATAAAGNGNAAAGDCAAVRSGGVGDGIGDPGTPSAMPLCNRMPPYLKIESVDADEVENLLLDYPQSPYSSRRNSSHDDNRSNSQLLHINRYEPSGRSHASTPSPYYLSPYAIDSSSGNIRRSSTSDIASCKRSGTSSASASSSGSRRPSTSDLLRRARERRGSGARMGRSVSHGGLTRGGGAGQRNVCGGGGGAGSGAGGRRTSMAF